LIWIIFEVGELSIPKNKSQKSQIPKNTPQKNGDFPKNGVNFLKTSPKTGEFSQKRGFPRKTISFLGI
jgi:hypothetical protein